MLNHLILYFDRKYKINNMKIHKFGEKIIAKQQYRLIEQYCAISNSD